MSILAGLGVVNLPPSNRTRATDHLAKLILAENPHVLLLIKVQAQGFLDELEAVQTVNFSTVEAMHSAIERIVFYRLNEFLMWLMREHVQAAVGQKYRLRP